MEDKRLKLKPTLGLLDGSAISVESHRRFDHACDHPHGGGLASSVGAQETEQLARLHFEVYVVHGCEIAEPLGQVLNFDGVHIVT